MTRKSVRAKLEDLTKSYNNLEKVPKGKRGSTFFSRLKNFKVNCGNLFDIRCKNGDRIKRQEKLWGVKETNEDVEFYQNQLEGMIRISITLIY